MALLSNRIAVITGALGAMGRVACERFHAEGATVIGVDLAPPEDGHPAVTGTDFTYFQADVGSEEQVEQLALRVKQQFQAIDILYNNAGIVLGKPILETSVAEWDHVIRVDLRSLFLMTKAFVPLIRTSGSIINVSSGAGILGRANMSAYGSAKAAVALFSRVSAVEFAPHIRVNAICPGVIDTPMPRQLIAALPDRDARWQSMMDGSLLKRAGEPEEVIALAVFLASSASSLMTGAVISIDGGETAHLP